MTMLTCVLLTTDLPRLAEPAEAYAKLLFDLRCSSRFSREQKKLSPEILLAIETGEIDYIFSFLSPIILPSSALRNARQQSINFHPAPPEWPGIGSASYALYNNDESFGVTAHLMAPQVDSGPILRVIRFPVLPVDTCETLFDRAFQYSLVLYYEVLLQIARFGPARPCGESWKRRAVTRAEFERWMTVSPNDPAEEIQRKVRALRHSRLPGPFVDLGGVRFEIPPSKKA